MDLFARLYKDTLSIKLRKKKIERNVTEYES